MKSSCFLGKVLVALGICMMLLSMSVAVDQAYADCSLCIGSCSGLPPGTYGEGCDTGTCVGWLCPGSCKCHKPFGNQDVCRCG